MKNRTIYKKEKIVDMSMKLNKNFVFVRKTDKKRNFIKLGGNRKKIKALLNRGRRAHGPGFLAVLVYRYYHPGFFKKLMEYDRCKGS